VRLAKIFLHYKVFTLYLSFAIASISKSSPLLIANSLSAQDALLHLSRTSVVTSLSIGFPSIRWRLPSHRLLPFPTTKTASRSTLAVLSSMNPTRHNCPSRRLSVRSTSPRSKARSNGASRALYNSASYTSSNEAKLPQLTQQRFSFRRLVHPISPTDAAIEVQNNEKRNIVVEALDDYEDVTFAQFRKQLIDPSVYCSNNSLVEWI
jgi:hypothetical protein